MKRKVEDRTDFISELPPPILHHILSYLSSEDSVRTSLLSKRWNSVQKSFPILEFDPPIDHWEFSPGFKERLREYLDFVDRSLQYFVQEKLRIEKMDICLGRVDRGSVPLVNTWLPLALHNGVSDLTFDSAVARESYQSDYFNLPETTFTVNSALLRGSSQSFLLKKLKLSNVRLTEKIVQDIICNCPNLSDLHLSSFYCLRTLNIPKPNKLSSLAIIEPGYSSDPTLQSVFVDAPSLQRVSLKLIQRNSPCEIDLTSCCSLREFDLRKSFITDAQLNRHISRFPLLEILNISFCLNLRRIRISHQRLKHLNVDDSGIRSIEIDAPILSDFVFIPSQDYDELPVLILADAIPGSMCITYTKYTHEVDSFRFLKIREYLTVPFKDITFCLDWRSGIDSSTEISFDIDKLREYAVPPPVEIACLEIADIIFRDSSNWETLLDGLLWSCHPKTVLMRFTSSYSFDDNCVKTLCRMLKKSECQLCSDLSHCKCWRSRFKAATVKSTGDIVFAEKNVRFVSEDLFLKPVYWIVNFRFDWGRSAIEKY